MLYTASPLLGKAVQSPIFQKKGIEGLTAGKLTQIHHVGFAIEKQVAYDGYVANLPAFLHATAVQKKTVTSAIYYPTPLSNDLTLPVPLPPLCVLARRPFKNEEEKLAFRATLGELEIEEAKGPKGAYFIIRKPLLSDLNKLPLNTIDPNAPSPVDATSVSGMISFIKTVKIISLFLSTHTYPYKQSGSDSSELTGDALALAWKKAECRMMTNYKRGTTELQEGYEGRLDFGVAEMLEEVDFEAEEGSVASGRHAVVVAKPAPLRPSINWGEPSTIPNLPGYILPYFRGLIDPSKDLIISTMRRYFLGSLADSKEKSGEAWYQWVKGVDKWYQTESGRIVTHILFNIQTALEAQARVYLFIRGTSYLGCSILGFGSAIAVNGRLVDPSTAVVARKEALELDGHSSAVEVIRELLEDAAVVTAMMVELDLSSSRKVFAAINAAPKLGDEEMERLTEAVSKLSFDEKFWSPDVQYILRAIRALNGEEEVDEDWPMYLDPSLLYDTTRANSVLAAFGPTAPAFVDAQGSDFPIPKGITADDPLSEFDPSTRKRGLETILLTMKRLPHAVGDWRNVVKKRRIRQNVVERAAGFRTIEFRGQSRDDIWLALRRMPFEEDKKRKRVDDRDDDDDSLEDPAAKKGKFKEARAADLDYSVFA